MASRTAAKQSTLPQRPANNDIDNYDVDDDPFAESGAEEAQNRNNSQSKKRKDATGLGIDEEVAVTKKPRVPRVKLDEARLLSEKGIPRLRRKAGDLKFKGKGHEFSDAARLLSFYQLWLDDLFPKAKFLDALAMVEKAGHKKYMRMKRIELIEEGKPRSSALADDEDIFGGPLNEPEEREPAKFPVPLAPIFQNSASERPKTPAAGAGDDLFGDDEDIYDATPRRPRTAEAPANSLFGNGGSAQQDGAPDEDELDALMAEEEAQRPVPPKSLFGDGNTRRPQDEPEEDDLDALMAEADAQSKSPDNNTNSALKEKPAAAEDAEDDLDALMAEAEAEAEAEVRGQGPAGQLALTASNSNSSKAKETTHTTDDIDVDEDEEAAMAEMDGLW
ncbi:replication fork protection component Swi3-domain-containing protein [Biscogniauxia marginata]|nr:replication fork protection component Swi3-domain-containing protein [Biscogniauxia marginata]